MTDKTQALLPVTQADRDLVYSLMSPAAQSEIEKLCLEYIRDGKGDDAETVQQVARHRISHSLPGDVGRLAEALKPFAQALDDWGDEGGGGNFDIFEHPTAININLDHLRDAKNALAALTPSALSGDAGEEIERLASRILDLAPSAGLLVGINIKRAHQGAGEP